MRSFTWPRLLRCPLGPPKPAHRGERQANAPRSRKLSEFGARAGDNDDLVFVTSDSISIFLVTIVSSDPYFLSLTLISYQARARFLAGEIRVLDSIGNVERTIAFNESERTL